MNAAIAYKANQATTETNLAFPKNAEKPSAYSVEGISELLETHLVLIGGGSGRVTNDY